MSQAVESVLSVAIGQIGQQIVTRETFKATDVPDKLVEVGVAVGGKFEHGLNEK
jgi:hypothetical protein